MLRGIPWIRNVFLTAALIMVTGCQGGYMSKSKNIVSYMEERYGTAFTYLGETNGMFGEQAFTAQLSCSDIPNTVILASYQKRDGEMYYADNYPAYQFHKDAFQKIDGAVRQVFADYRLFFRVPDVLLTIDNPEDYMLEDYLADPLAFKSIYILVCNEVDKAEFQELMKAFEMASISVKGLLATPRNWPETAAVTEESIGDYLANPDRLKMQVNFTLENGVLWNEKWRQ